MSEAKITQFLDVSPRVLRDINHGVQKTFPSIICYMFGRPWG